ncbi:alkyl sulfatase BDS1-like metallo-beta-lactamase superfamily hydrolase [Arthrobacter sp. CAN_A2]|uniref:hypothetical protein n=1 Tax=Arthrobacter sp. CAN_A2 TaxID=2787718 RepID=UPI0018EFF9EA
MQQKPASPPLEHAHRVAREALSFPDIRDVEDADRGPVAAQVKDAPDQGDPEFQIVAP